MRGKEIAGLPIFNISDGRKIGNIKDTIVDIDKKKVLGFTVDRGGIFGPGRKVLDMKDISSIGPDAVTVSKDGEEAFRDEEDNPEIHKIIEEGHSIFGKKILTRSGKDLGDVADIVINTDNGEVEGYEISGGIGRDIGRGRPVVPLTRDLVAGEDAIIVPDETEDLMEEDVGGIAGAYQATKEKTGEVYGKASGAVQSQYEKTRKSIEEDVGKGMRSLEEEEIKEARGRVADKDVTADDGTMVVAEGEVIDGEVIERAKAKNMVHQVALAAGLTRFKKRYDELQSSGEESVGRAEEELLLGGTAGQDVTDREGHMIVAGGNKIDMEAIRSARAAGVIGDLMASAGIGGARNTWASLTSGFSRYRERTEHGSAAASQRRFLVGRIAASDVNDKHGHPIVRQGDVITPLMVERVKDENKLYEMKVMPEEKSA